MRGMPRSCSSGRRLAALACACFALRTAASPSEARPSGAPEPAGGALDVRRFGARCDYDPRTHRGTDDTRAIQAAIDEGLETGREVRLPPGRCRITGSPGLRIQGSVRLRGMGRLGAGGSYLVYTGDGTAIEVRPPGWPKERNLYAAVLEDFGVMTDGRTADRAFAIFGLSEGSLSRLAVGGTRASRFRTGFYMEGAGIVEMSGLLLSYLDEAGIHLAASRGDRWRTNATLTVREGDFFDIRDVFRLEVAVGVDVQGSWFENFDTAFLLDDGEPASTGLLVENLFVHHNFFQSGKARDGFAHQQVLRIQGAPRKWQSVDNVRIEANRMNFAPGLTQVDHAISVQLPQDVDPRSDVMLALAGNRVSGVRKGFVRADSARVRVQLGSNTILRRDATRIQAEVEGPAVVAAWRHVGSAVSVGANSAWGHGTLAVHQPDGATQLAIRAGGQQGAEPLLAWYDASGSVAGAITPGFDLALERGGGVGLAGAGGKRRWRVRADGAADGDLVVERRDASGAAVDAPLRIDGATGAVALGTGSSPILAHRAGAASWAPPSLADGAVASTTVAVPEVLPGDVVAVSFDAPLPAGSILQGNVTAPGTVTVNLLNRTGRTLTLASGKVRASAWRLP